METYDHRAAAGVADRRLKALLEDHWEALMRRYPVWASRIGDRRFDDALPGTGPADHESRRAERDGFLSRAWAIEPGDLAERDRLTHALFVEDLETSAAVDAGRPEEWTVLPRNNPVTFLGWLPELRPVESSEELAALLTRYRAFPDTVTGEIECLSAGAEDGRFANAESVRRLVEMVRAELAKDTADWAPAKRIACEGGPEAARIVLDAGARPALAKYVQFLEGEILPHARTGEEVGLTALPGGDDHYAALIREHTSLPLSAEEVHRTGLEQLEIIHGEFAELGSRALGTGKILEIFARLRSDPELFFDSAEAVEGRAAEALTAAKAAMPAWFGRMPKADCVVMRIPEHEAPYTTVAYYRPPPADGSGPGEYRINVHAPETRPRHEALALAFHESIPGHHLQIAIAQELPEMPAFRRHGGVTSYVEGWALYTERLAEEMGLYESDLDRLGMLSFDAWRAARLVVDTGVHAFRWTRERAISFMTEMTPLAPNNIDNEVDRYISWPGQALSYMVGGIAFRRLRRESEEALGPDFDVKAWHDLVLGSGAVPLSVLERNVRRWAGGPS